MIRLLIMSKSGRNSSQPVGYAQQTQRALFLCCAFSSLVSCIVNHERRSSVKFGGQDIFARKYMHEKLTNARILHDFCPKNIFFPNFFLGGEGQVTPSAPTVSYAYVVNCISKSCKHCILSASLVSFHVIRWVKNCTINFC